MQDTGIDRFAVFAAGLGHGASLGFELISRYWTEACNDLIARIARLVAGQVSPVCQLPQSPGVSPKHWVEELEPLCHRAGVCGLQYQPGCGRRPRALHALARR